MKGEKKKHFRIFLQRQKNITFLFYKSYARWLTFPVLRQFMKIKQSQNHEQPSLRFFLCVTYIFLVYWLLILLAKFLITKYDLAWYKPFFCCFFFFFVYANVLELHLNNVTLIWFLKKIKFIFLLFCYIWSCTLTTISLLGSQLERIVWEHNCQYLQLQW